MNSGLELVLDAIRDPAAANRGGLRALERAVEADAEARMAGALEAREVERVRDGALAAIELALAGTVLADLARWREHGLDGAALARDGLLRAAQVLADAPVVPAATVTDGAEPVEPSAAMDLAVMHNLALHHREHERYYTQALAEGAVDLFREANRLRVVAMAVIRDAEARRDVDYTLPQYAAAGCVDLNEPAAIASIGVLFMEGEGEPAELRVLKAKLQGMSVAGMQAGKWLADKSQQAWQREQTLLRPDLVAVAEARFATILTNWRVARQTQLVARLAGLVLARLGRIDFRPAAVRAARREVSEALLDCGAVLAAAGQIKLQSAGCQANNDRPWTEYLAHLATVKP